MKHIKIMTILLIFSMMLVPLTMVNLVDTAQAFEQDIFDFDRIWYDDSGLGFNKIGVGILILAVTYTNATAEEPNFRTIDYCDITFNNDPFYFSITVEDELYVETDYEGNIIYQEPADGYLYLRKTVADTYLPDDIKELASKSQSLSTISFQGNLWYRIYCPDFNREYVWKQFSEPTLKEKWFTWGSEHSLKFLSRAMYIFADEISSGHITLDITHDSNTNGQQIAINKIWLADNGITKPIFELGRWGMIQYTQNETHYIINPEHFSAIGIHNATTGESLGTVEADNSPHRIDFGYGYGDIDNVEFSYDGSLLAFSACGGDSKVFIVNTTDWTNETWLAPPDTPIIYDIKWSHNDSKIVVGATSVNQYYVYNSSDWSEWSNTTAQSTSVIGVNFKTDDSAVYVGPSGSFVKRYDPDTLEYLGQETSAYISRGAGIAVSEDGNYYAFGSYSYVVRVLNQTTNSEVDGVLENDNGLAMSADGLEYSPDSNYLMVAWDDRVGIYDATASHDLYKYIYPSGSDINYGSSWTRDSNYIGFGDDADYAYIYTVGDGFTNEVYRFDEATSNVRSTSFNNDNQLFAYGSDDDYVYVHHMFNTTRSTGSFSEQNNVTFMPSYNLSGNVTLKIPISSSVTSITEVYSNKFKTTATEVNDSTELVNNSFWFDASNKFVYIRTVNSTIDDYLNWTVNCSYGAEFDISFPSYLEIGDYMIAYGRITDANGDGINGLITETHIYQSGEDVIEPVYWNCTGGNYQATMYTTSLEPGVYSISVEYTDGGITNKEGHTLYLATDVPYGSGIHISSMLNFLFYDSDTGEGLNPDLFKIYVSDDTTFTEDDRIHRTYYNTITDNILYYKVLDYFDNMIYPTVGSYESVQITNKHQFEDIPIDWHSFSAKNMNHSIVRFNLTNDTRTYSQFLFPYEPFYWDVLPGNYDINLTYYDPDYTTPSPSHITNYYNTTISITDDTYYWIVGYDLQDIIIEIQFTNTSVNDFELSITTNIDFVNSTVNNITSNIQTSLTLTESNLTTLNNNIWNAINITDTVVDYINNTVWNQFTGINLTVGYINNSLWSELSLIGSNISSLNNTIINTITLFESNLTSLNNQIWNSLNITDSVIDYINNTIWNEISAVNLTVDYLNSTIWTEFTLIGADIDYLNSTVFTNFTFVNSSVNTLTNHVTTMWNAQNSSFMELTNRSAVILSFYNTNEGLGLDRETLKVYINGTRLIGTTFYCYNASDKINLTIKDYYNNTLYHNNFTITAPYTFIDLGLTFHSWLFGNKNDDYYMISIRRYGATRWWERGIIPYGEREFILPSGNYTMRIYDKDYNEIYNSSGNISVTNSRVYVIHGTNLSEIISGQSIIRGQLLELSDELYQATMPEIIYSVTNPPRVYSILMKEGSILGTKLVCPAVYTIATTENSSTINSSTIFYPLIPDSDTDNGTITVREDTMYFSVDSTVSWMNISYSGTYTNYTIVPNHINLLGENVTVNTDGNITVTRETQYQQLKKFYWTKYTDTLFYTASLSIINPFNATVIKEVYVIIEFANDTTPDYVTTNLYDVTNGVYLTRGENFFTSASGIHFYLDLINASGTRQFTANYYSTEATQISSDAIVIVDEYQDREHYNANIADGSSYYYVMAQWVNQDVESFIGNIDVQFNFDTDPYVISKRGFDVYDRENGIYLDRDDFTWADGTLTISQTAVGTVVPNGARTFDIYFLFVSEDEEENPVEQAENWLKQPVFWGLQWFHILVIVLGFIGVAFVANAYDKHRNWQKWTGNAWIASFCFFFIFLLFMWYINM